MQNLGEIQTGIYQVKIPSRKLEPGRYLRKRGSNCQDDSGHDVQIWQAWTHRQLGPQYASGPQTRQAGDFMDAVRGRSGEFPVNGSPRSPR